ncbi:MAG TPA: DUF3999 domain-containing protein, partial [Nevskia sp.]|nr:DUF3999 domain-containing protein [Nevskia sp.]
MKQPGVLLLSLLALSAAAGSAGPQDYRSGIELVPAPGLPVGELSLPDAVYQGVTRSDLGDLRVFNAQNTPVPSALCVPAPAPPAAATELPLKLYPLQAARAAAAGTHVEVQTQGPVNVEVQPVHADNTAPATEVAAYVIDARAAQAPLQALRFRWRTADGASELHVRVEASEDLDRWFTLVPETTLVQAGAAGQGLQRERVPLPSGRHAYLRVTRNDSGPAPELDAVIAELEARATPQEEPRWFEPQALPPDPDHAYAFDAERLAPVRIARITLPAPNMSLQVVLQSRAGKDGPWHAAWSGAVYSLGADQAERHNEDLRFAGDSDRYWRIQVLQGADSLGAGKPALRLGYQPARLRFLVQGGGNFLLAYGSARAEIPPGPGCEALLPGLTPAEQHSMIGAAQAGEPRELGGDAALRPAPRPTPLRQILLWGLL